MWVNDDDSLRIVKCEENNKEKIIKGGKTILKDIKLRAHAPQSLDSCTSMDKLKKKKRKKKT